MTSLLGGMADDNKPSARVLVVDDELINRMLIEAILDAEHYEIVHAETGELALELIAREHIDLVLLDVMMPGIDGIEVCRRIRQDLDRPLLPVVVISALTDAASRTRGKEAGADDFLTKPIHADELVIRTRNLLLMREYYWLSERHRQRAEVEARRWRFVSDVATALAGCLSYESVTATVLLHLRQQLGAATTAFCEVVDDQLQLAAIAPHHADRRIVTISHPAPARSTWFAKHHAGAFDELVEVLETNEMVMLPIVSRDEVIGVFCVGLSAPFESSELELFEALRPHISNVIVNVKSHLATVADLLANERERKEAEAALVLSETRHQLLFEGSPLPIWIFNLDNEQVVAANQAFVQLCGYSRRELRSMMLRELFPGGASAASATDRIQRLHCKSGRTADLDVTSHPLTLDDQPVRVSIGVDMTHARLVEEQLRQSQKMEGIGRLAGGVAHDFNNILAAIMSNAELAHEVIGDHHAISIEVQGIEEAARMGADLTRQLLAFSRKQRRDVRAFEVASVVRKLERLLTRIVDEHVTITTDLGGCNGTIRADASQIEQVVMNLVVNARDSMPAGGHLTIAISDVEVDDALAMTLGVVAGAYVALTVTDTGCGMDPSVIDHIFEPFFTTKEVGKGTGLGLSTVFGIVKESDGAITVESVVGSGSTFRVYLPRVEQVAAVAPATTFRLRRCTNPATILLVEDNASLRSAMCRQLTACGYNLIEARDAAHALSLVAERQEPIHLLLTDLVMPGIDGRALANRIVDERPGTKVLIMSGYTEHAAVTTTDVVASDFIAKPFTNQQLTAAVRRLLSPTRQERDAGISPI